MSTGRHGGCCSQGPRRSRCVGPSIFLTIRASHEGGCWPDGVYVQKPGGEGCRGGRHGPLPRHGPHAKQLTGLFKCFNRGERGINRCFESLLCWMGNQTSHVVVILSFIHVQVPLMKIHAILMPLRIVFHCQPDYGVPLNIRRMPTSGMSRAGEMCVWELMICDHFIRV